MRCRPWQRNAIGQHFKLKPTTDLETVGPWERAGIVLHSMGGLRFEVVQGMAGRSRGSRFSDFAWPPITCTNEKECPKGPPFRPKNFSLRHIWGLDRVP